MAKVKYSEFVEALDAAAALDGTETVVVLQDGLPVETTTQDIADLGGGGAAPTVSAKTADFTADGASGTIYAMDGTGPTNVTATLGGSLDIGTKYTFLAYVQDGILTVKPASGETITYNDGNGGSWTATNATGINLIQYGSHITALKVSATEWYSISESWVEPQA